MQSNHTATKRELFSLFLIIFAAIIITGITMKRYKSVEAEARLKDAPLRWKKP